MNDRSDHGSPALDFAGLSPDRWAAIDRVLEVVLELPPEEIEPALDRLCGGEPLLRSQALAVLRADRNASGFLGRSALGLLKPTKEDSAEPERA